jgi:eukaryotic-like serine/threonine-protein kinase
VQPEMKKVGSYEILALLGAGGMGEVYRAHDSKLGRDVAIKILPPAFAADTDRMARFQREAQLLASLNHPHIATIYGVEESAGAPALIMELVEGPTLADRIAVGPIPLDEALAIARQLADGLEFAHEKGIVHRDLKPANVKLTRDGQVKVLDFGLAKAMADDLASGNPMNSPTLTLSATRAGVILGTAAYMPPEQAKGKTVDRRADIWAFGVVLYEMLTGSRGYNGETAAETLASVIKEELEWSRLPAGIPPHIRRLLRRCLEKDPRRRLRDIGEARIAIDEPPAELPPVAAPAPRAASPLPWIAAGLLLAGGTALAWTHFRETPPVDRVLRYSMDPPDKSSVHSFAVSPDGRMLAIAGTVQGKGHLWLRPLDTLQAQLLAGTDAAQYPFWSPDSRYIGFFAQGKLKKIAAAGGPAQSLCDAPLGRGGSWALDGTILFAPAPDSGLQRVSSAGGIPVVVTPKPKTSDRFPALLSDGRHFVHIVTGTPEESGIHLGALDGKENRRLIADASSATYVPPAPGQRIGYLLFLRDSTLMAQPVDTRNLQLTGEMFPVAEHISFGANNNFAPVAASSNGVLVYQAGRAIVGAQMIWTDRAGKTLGQPSPPGGYWDLSLSPDEKTVAISKLDGANTDIWLHDIGRGTDTRLTFAAMNAASVWSPKSDRIAFASTRNGSTPDLFLKSAGGTGGEEVLLASPLSKFPYDWSRDGRWLIYGETGAKARMDLLALPLDVPASQRKPVPLVTTDFEELQGQVSPDGHWLAYVSDESNLREIYLRPFPAGDGKWKVSNTGGEQPRWRQDGKELFFLDRSAKLFAVPVKSAPTPTPSVELGPPEPLFDTGISLVAGAGVAMQYSVAANGQRFLVLRSGDPGSEVPLTVEVNWLTRNRPAN